MADVFLSYAHEDRAAVARIASALKRGGFTVWWDEDLSPGTRFRDRIRHEIESARAVVVIWSAMASEKDWVLAEAALPKVREWSFA